MRVVQRLLAGFAALEHRGCRPSRLGEALRMALQETTAAAAATSRVDAAHASEAFAAHKFASAAPGTPPGARNLAVGAFQPAFVGEDSNDVMVVDSATDVVGVLDPRVPVGALSVAAAPPMTMAEVALASAAPLAATRPKRIRLTVKDQQGSETQCTCKGSTPLRRIMDTYCSGVGLRAADVWFSFAGRALKPDQSAESFGLKDKDIITVGENGGPRARGGAVGSQRPRRPA